MLRQWFYVYFIHNKHRKQILLSVSHKWGSWSSENSNRPRSCNKWLAWPNFLGSKGPCPLSPCPAPGRLPCRHAGTYLGVIILHIMNSHTYFTVFASLVCDAFVTLNMVWNDFYNILILLKSGPYKSTEFNKIYCGPMNTSEGHTGLLWRGVPSRCVHVQSLSHADS